MIGFLSLSKKMEACGSSSTEVEDPERSAIREQISTMSFEELQKLKEKMGTKLYHETIFGKKGNKQQDFKRPNKNRPREISSKQKAPRFGEYLSVKKERTRDPRFDPSCGDYNRRKWQDDYSFISDLRKQDITKLKEELRETEDESEREKIRYLMQRLKNQLREEKRVKDADVEKQKSAQEHVDMLKQGKKPYFFKKSVKRELELADKYETLKSSGKLDKYLKKRRQKIKSKHRNKL